MSLQVKDNKYRNTIIAVSAEAYEEMVSLDNLSRSPQEDKDGCKREDYVTKPDMVR